MSKNLLLSAIEETIQPLLLSPNEAAVQSVLCVRQGLLSVLDNELQIAAASIRRDKRSCYIRSVVVVIIR